MFFKEIFAKPEGGVNTKLVKYAKVSYHNKRKWAKSPKFQYTRANPTKA